VIRAALLLAALLATAGCQTAQRLAPLEDAPFAPGAAPSTGLLAEEAVDGLTVGHRLMAAAEYELALRAYYRAALDTGMTPDLYSAVGSANLKLGRLNQAEELLRKAGSDSVVCTATFDAHFVSAELLNPGVQDVLAQLTSNLHGQQIYVTPFDGKKAIKFSDVAESCRAKGHIALGVKRDDDCQLNVPGDHSVSPGDGVVTVGPERLDSLG